MIPITGLPRPAPRKVIRSQDPAEEEAAFAKDQPRDAAVLRKHQELQHPEAHIVSVTQCLGASWAYRDSKRRER
jgi:hypothetical protein